MDEEKEDRAIEFYKDHPSLWNSNTPDWSRPDLKDHCLRNWQQKLVIVVSILQNIFKGQKMQRQ